MSKDSQLKRDPHVHSVYPHEPGRLISCPACEFNCHCDPVAVAEGRETVCVWLGHEENEVSSNG
jgi:hypothetical protein